MVTELVRVLVVCSTQETCECELFAAFHCDFVLRLDGQPLRHLCDNSVCLVNSQPHLVVSCCSPLNSAKTCMIILFSSSASWILAECRVNSYSFFTVPSEYAASAKLVEKKPCPPLPGIASHRERNIRHLPTNAQSILENLLDICVSIPCHWAKGQSIMNLP